MINNLKIKLAVPFDLLIDLFHIYVIKKKKKNKKEAPILYGSKL